MESEQAFLQSLLAARVISEERLQDLYRSLGLGETQSLDKQTARANASLKHLSLNLRKVRNDLRDGNWYYVLVNIEEPRAADDDTSTSESSGESNTLTRSESIFLQKLLDRIFERAQNGIEESKLPADMRRDTRTLGRLENDGWIERTGGGRIFITVRTMLELEPFLAAQYGGSTLMPCMGCKSWVLKGRRCANDRCNASLHHYCYDDFFAATNGEPGVCPHCQGAL